MTSPQQNGWRLVDTKNSEEPSVTLPRPNWSDQYDTTTPKLKSSLVTYRTCYHTHWVWMISMFEFVMACLSACRVWNISSSGNFECWQSGRRFLGSCKQPVIRPSMPWACRGKRCLRGYPLQDRFPWIVFTYSFSSSILMFFWWPPVRLACLGHAVRKEVASKTPYQDRDGAILPFFLFFCFLFEYLLVVSIVHFLESSMTGVLPSKGRKIFGEAMWKFSKFVFLAWLLKILIRVWTGFGELKQVDRSYPVCLFDSKFDKVVAKTSPLGVVVSYWSLQFGRGSVTLISSECFVSTSLQPFCCGDVMCCDVMCDDVMGCHTGRWRCGEQGPHTGHYCRHRKNTVAHMPDSWSSRLWYARFGAIPLFRRLSLFLSVWYSYSKFIHFFLMWECKAADMKFPFLAFYSQPFSRP